MRVTAALLGLVALTGCDARRNRDLAPIPGAKIAVVVLENRGPHAVLDRGGLARAASHGGRAINAVGEPHPAQPFFVMLSGSLRPVTDAQAVSTPSPIPNLTDQLDRHHVTWRAYMDNMPYPCFGRMTSRDTVGLYAKRHNPFMFFSSVVSDARECRTDVVPGRRLHFDITHGRLPRFTWITPNLCEDMHSCPVAAGERWMASALPPLLRALGPHGLLFVVADERSPMGRGGGPIPLVALGGAVQPGSIDRQRVDHRALLATIEDVLGLGRLPTTFHSRDLAPLVKADEPTLQAILRRPRVRGRDDRRTSSELGDAVGEMDVQPVRNVARLRPEDDRGWVGAAVRG